MREERGARTFKCWGLKHKVQQEDGNEQEVEMGFVGRREQSGRCLQVRAAAVN